MEALDLERDFSHTESKETNMEKVTFYSYKPYLQICLHRKRGIFVTFSAKCSYSSANEVQLELLRKYAEKTKGSYIISESMDPEELRRRYEELEENTIKEAEAREAAKLAAEKEKQEAHEFYSTLRFSNKVCR